MNSNTFRTILLALFFTAFSGLFFYLTIKDRFDFLDRVEFNGLQRISEAELKDAITALNLKNKNFWQINPRKISLVLAKRPLVKNIKIRTRILPKAHYQIFVLEDTPWALYRDAVYDDNAVMIVDSPAAAKLFQSQAVTSLYEDFAKDNSGLIQIKSYKIIGDKELKLVRETQLIVQKYLQIINDQDAIVEADLDSEANLTLRSKNYFFILGALDSDLLKRTKKLEQVCYSAGKLKNELDYVDLSLNTEEAIIGKK